MDGFIMHKVMPPTKLLQTSQGRLYLARLMMLVVAVGSLIFPFQAGMPQTGDPETRVGKVLVGTTGISSEQVP